MLRAAFGSNMRESSSRRIAIGEPWDLATFSAFIKCLYCFDFKKGEQQLWASLMSLSHGTISSLSRGWNWYPAIIEYDWHVPTPTNEKIHHYSNYHSLDDVLISFQDLLKNLRDFDIDAASAGLLVEYIVEDKSKRWKSSMCSEDFYSQC